MTGNMFSFLFNLFAEIGSLFHASWDGQNRSRGVDGSFDFLETTSTLGDTCRIV